MSCDDTATSCQRSSHKKRSVSSVFLAACLLLFLIVTVVGLWRLLIAEYWQRQLSSPNPRDRIQALEYYSNWPSKYETLIRASLSDEDPEVRIAAVRHLAALYQYRRLHPADYGEYLRNFNNASKPTVVAILTLANDDNVEVREEAFKALGDIRTDAPLVIPVVIARIEQDDAASIRKAAAEALADYGRVENLPTLTPLFAKLIQFLDHSESNIVISVIETFRNLGSDGSPALQNLFRKFADSNERIRGAAVRAFDPIFGLRPEASEFTQPAIDALGQMVGTDRIDSEAVRQAVNLLGYCGSRSRRHINILIDRFWRESPDNPHLECAIVESLAKIGDSSVVPFLKTVTRETSNDTLRRLADRAILELQ